MEAEQDVLTVNQVAKILNVCGKSVRIWIKAEKLGHFRVGRLVRVRRCQLEAFINRSGAKGESQR